MYCRVMSAIGMSRMSRFCRRIMYSSRSSGPSKASRKTSSACGGMYRSLGSWVMASPFTMANGISTCSGEPAALSAVASAASAFELSTTMRRSGFAAFFAMSVHSQVHHAPHVVHGGARGFARLLGALGHDVAHQLGILFEFLRALADAADLLDDLLDERLLALETADAGRAAAVGGPGAGFLARIDLVQVEHRAHVRVAGIRAAHARRIRLHRLELLRELVRIL